MVRRASGMPLFCIKIALEQHVQLSAPRIHFFCFSLPCYTFLQFFNLTYECFVTQEKNTAFDLNTTPMPLGLCRVARTLS